MLLERDVARENDARLVGNRGNYSSWSTWILVGYFEYNLLSSILPKVRPARLGLHIAFLQSRSV